MRAKVSSVAPTMALSWPDAACTGVPPSGASASAMPAAASSSASATVEVGSAVELSTITEPRLRLAASPSLPRIRASTSREPVTQRKTMELRSAIRGRI